MSLALRIVNLELQPTKYRKYPSTVVPNITCHGRAMVFLMNPDASGVELSTLVWAVPLPKTACHFL